MLTGCKKGDRDCEFPQHNSLTGKLKSDPSLETPLTESGAKSASTARRRESLGSSESSHVRDGVESLDDEDEDQETIEPEDDEDRMTTTSAQSTERTGDTSRKASTSTSISSKQIRVTNDRHATSRQDGDRTKVPRGSSSPTTPKQTSRSIEKLANNFEPSMKGYLQYYHDHMTTWHYMLRTDSTGFLQDQILTAASTFEPLQYALVAFASYHYTLAHTTHHVGFEPFWQYYANAILKLRLHLATHQEANEHVLLTVLQLATFEEYLGDWVSISAHLRAAHKILTRLYTTKAAMERESALHVQAWFARFDNSTGLAALRSTLLDQTRSEERMQSLHAQIDRKSLHYQAQRLRYLFSRSQFMANELADISVRLRQANNSQAQGVSVRHLEKAMMTDLLKLAGQLQSFRRELSNISDRGEHVVMVDVSDAFDRDAKIPYIPVYTGAVWGLNILWIEWYAWNQVIKYKSYIAVTNLGWKYPVTPNPADEAQQLLAFPLQDLAIYSMYQCWVYEATMRTAGKPDGLLLAMGAAMGSALTFLPPDHSPYITWARRLMAGMEHSGYMYPPPFRREMCRRWRIPASDRGWIPNQYVANPLVSELCKVVEDRHRAAIEEFKRTGLGDSDADIREVRALFEMLEVTPVDHKSETALVKRELARNPFDRLLSSLYQAELSDSHATRRG